MNKYLKSIIFIIIGFFMFIIVSNLTYNSNQNVDEEKIRKEKAVRYIEESLLLEKKLNGISISDIKSKEKLSLILRHRMHVLHDVMFLGTKLDPSWITTDRIKYSVIKFDQGCKIVDKDNLQNSSCVIKINTKPSTKTGVEDNSNIFFVAIDGNRDPIEVVR